MRSVMRSRLLAMRQEQEAAAAALAVQAQHTG